MEKYYYLVPIYNEHTYINGFRFSELFSNAFPKVYDVVLRIEELCEKGLTNVEEFRHCKEIIDNHFKHFVIPEYIIVEEYRGELHELETRCVIETDKLADLEIHYVDNIDWINEYINNTRYKNRIANLIKYYILRNNNKKSELQLKRNK